MQPVVRMRLERNVEYHEKVAEYHRKMAEPEVKEGEAPVEETDEVKKHREDATIIADMHAEAAKQLRDLLNSEPLTPVLDQVKADREANTIVRDRTTIVARSTMH